MMKTHGRITRFYCLMSFSTWDFDCFFQSQSEETTKKVNLLKDMHFRSLSQKAMLVKRTEEAVKQLETIRMHTGGK